MLSAATLGQKELATFLRAVAPIRPIFIWGPPGIGKSSIVQAYAAELGLDCVSLLGSQLAPEDLIGVPQILAGEGTSRFCPPRTIARPDPYVLFLDELNASGHEVQKAFYSLILERRIGEYVLPAGSIVLAAGNRAQDAAIVKPLSSALVNRLVHVQLHVVWHDWLEWATTQRLHRLVTDYVAMRPDHLWSEPPKHEEPYSTPRSWHMLSDALRCYGDQPTPAELDVLARGCLSPDHAIQLTAFARITRKGYRLEALLDGSVGWPTSPDDRDILYFLVQSLRARLLQLLPPERGDHAPDVWALARRGRDLVADLAAHNLEMAQIVVAADARGHVLPDWYLTELVRHLPALADSRRHVA